MHRERETVIRVFGTERTVRTEQVTGTERKLESTHQAAVKAALHEMYAAVPDADKERLADRMREQARTERDMTAAEAMADAAKIVGRHRFNPPKSRWVDARRPPQTVRYTLSPQDVLDRHSDVTHEYVQDTIPAPQPTPPPTPTGAAAGQGGPPRTDNNKKEGPMSDLVPRAGAGAPAPADGDNRYKAVQAKLAALGRALDDAGVDLEALVRSVQRNAKRAEDVASDIANAGLDPKFVELTSNVSVALGGAAVQVRKLADTAAETADLTHQTRSTHSKLYGALDDIRSNRREKTPKPGFFVR
jgi:hypothetical protein